MDVDHFGATSRGHGEDARDGLLRSVFDESPVAILRVTQQAGHRVVVDANPAAAALLGRSAEEMVGTRVEDLVPGVTAAHAEPGVPGQARAVRVSTPGVLRDRWVAISISPLTEQDRRASRWPW